MRLHPLVAAVLLAFGQMSSASAEPPDRGQNVLKNDLNRLESQAVQRQGRSESVLDLLNRQDSRLARQTLNTLRTRTPGDSALPPLERQFERSQRPRGTLPHR